MVNFSGQTAYSNFRPIVVSMPNNGVVMCKYELTFECKEQISFDSPKSL
jgi:hypothetical protein